MNSRVGQVLHDVYKQFSRKNGGTGVLDESRAGTLHRHLQVSRLKANLITYRLNVDPC